MKKYFSLIAVAMIALSSVFTSCSKDGSGSTFDPDLGQSAYTTNTTSNTTSSLVEETNKLKEEYNNKTISVSMHVTMELADSSSSMSPKGLAVLAKLASMVNKKVESTGKAYVYGGGITVEYKRSAEQSVLSILKAISSDDIKNAVGSDENVQKIKLSTNVFMKGNVTTNWQR